MARQQQLTRTGFSRTPLRFAVLTALLIALAVSLLLPSVVAVPSGASVAFVSNTTNQGGVADSRTDPRSTINTIQLTATQQDAFWKAYVGNVTGSIVLADAANNRIYDWSLAGATITGRVFVARNSSTIFTNVSCVDNATVAAEQTYLNMTGTSVDSINKTFNNTFHKSFFVGEISIAEGSCRSVATYINSTAQTLNTSAYFQEVLLQDSANNFIYATMIENNQQGFDNQQYDFQIIVGESDVRTTPTTYFFFTEIGT